MTAESWAFWVTKGRYVEEVGSQRLELGRRSYCGWRVVLSGVSARPGAGEGPGLWPAAGAEEMASWLCVQLLSCALLVLAASSKTSSGDASSLSIEETK